MKHTKNFSFPKPNGDDFYDIEVFGKAMDMLDEQLNAAIAHTKNTSNPHQVTKSKIGLGNVENKTSETIRGELTDANIAAALDYKPVSPVDFEKYKASLNGSLEGLKKTLESIVSIKKNYEKYFDNDENIRHTVFDICGKIGVELFYIDQKYYGSGVDANKLYGVPLETSHFYSHMPFLIAGLKGKSMQKDGAYGNITATVSDTVVSLNKGDGAQYKFDAYINNAANTRKSPSMCVLCVGKLA